MHWFYELFFPVVWTVFLVYWQVKAANTKSNQRMEPVGSRIFRVLVFLIAMVLLLVPRIPLSWLGAAVTVSGLLFAVWARVHLGRNWSRSVTIKQDHELITTGPYAVVRHPIYTGILAGFFGMAIAISEVRGVIVFFLILLVFWIKFRMEEKFMRSQFGEPYAAYIRKTSALVPYVL